MNIPPRVDRSRRIRFILLGLVLVGGLAVRLRGADVRALNHDEAFSWRVATRPVGTMVGQIAGDTHPLLHFLILKSVMMVFGASPLVLRVPSIMVGVATIAVVYGLSVAAIRYAGDRDGVPDGRVGWAALAAASYLAIHPAHIEASQTARMYSFAAGFAALSSWLLLEAVGRPTPSRRLYLAYAVVAAMMLHSHNFGLFVVAAQLGFATLEAWRQRAGRDRWLALLGAGTLVALLYAPWVPMFLAQARRVHSGFWIPPVTWETLSWEIVQFLFGADMIDRATSLTLAGLLLFLLGWPLALGNDLRRWPLPAQVMTVWILAILISTIGGRPILQERYLLLAFPAFAGWFAMAITATKPGWASWSLACLLLVPTGHATGLVLAKPWQSPLATREAIEFLREEGQPGDVVLVRRPGLVNVFVYYQNRNPGHVLDIRYVFDLDELERIGQVNHISSFDPGQIVDADHLGQLQAHRAWVLNGAYDLEDLGWTRQSVTTFGQERGESDSALQLVCYVRETDGTPPDDPGPLQ